jgi:hypothetical protein
VCAFAIEEEDIIMKDKCRRYFLLCSIYVHTVHIPRPRRSGEAGCWMGREEMGQHMYSLIVILECTRQYISRQILRFPQ